MGKKSLWQVDYKPIYLYLKMPTLFRVVLLCPMTERLLVCTSVFRHSLTGAGREVRRKENFLTIKVMFYEACTVKYI